MALVIGDRVLETSTTSGSGSISLAGASPGYQPFSTGVGNGNQTYYTIALEGGTEWEVGIGTYTSVGDTLSRDTVLASSAGGAKVSFSAGTKQVFVTYPAEKAVYGDQSGNISAASNKIINVATPTVAGDAANKQYVDDLVAAGITYHTPVKYEVPDTTGNLNATYYQPGGAGVGVSATLTNAGTLAAFVPDGVTASISDRILIYNQTNAYENGIYTVTTVGNGSTAWVLTRSTDTDSYALKSPTGLGEGDAFFVTSGNTGAGETYVCNTNGTITFGTTPINFVQVSATQIYAAGNGIVITGPTISLDVPVTVPNGGTGLTTAPANGQLLTGNGTGYSLNTLQAGTGVSIANAPGSITISISGTIGDVAGPASSTNNAVARFDGATGKLLKDTSDFIIDASNNVGIGGAPSADTKMNFTGTAPVSANYSYGIANRMAAPSTAASAAYAFYSEANGSGTVPWFHHFYAVPGASASNVTTRYGFNVNDGLLTTGNVYGVLSDIKTAVGYTRFSVYAPGTAPNYFGGNTLIGGTAGGAVATEALEISAGNKFRINGATSGYTTLKAPTTGNNIDYTLPSADGTSGQVLSTNGSGTLSWTTAGGGGSAAGAQAYAWFIS